MEEERVTLSAGEQRRVVVLNHLEKGAVTVGEAAQLLGISGGGRLSGFGRPTGEKGPVLWRTATVAGGRRMRRIRSWRSRC
jgi:hypothetical protein